MKYLQSAVQKLLNSVPARQADEQNTTRTFVSLDQKNKKIAGYVSLSNTCIEKATASDVLQSRANPLL